MTPGLQYQFEDLCYENYGFDIWGPILATGNYKTEMLKQLNFKITENSSYVDMEFNCYSILNANTITYYPLDIYRYFIGRNDQSINIQSYKKKFLQHENVVMNLINLYYNNEKQITKLKKKYLLEKLIVPMINAQYIILCEYLKSRKEFIKFDNKIKKFPTFYNNPKVANKFITLTRITNGMLIKIAPFLRGIYKKIKRGR